MLKNSFGDRTTDACKIASLLNYKLATLGDLNNRNRYRQEKEIKSPTISTTRYRFDFRYLTSKEVLGALRQLNGNKPLEPTRSRDEHFQMQLRAYTYHSVSIKSMLSKCKSSPMITKKLKSRFKKGKEVDTKKYRPRSIKPTLAKVFERLMQNQMTDYLERKKYCHLVDSVSANLLYQRHFTICQRKNAVQHQY